MTIKVTGKNLDVGDALRGYVQERVVHTVEKFIGREPTGHVRIEKEHGDFRTNCTIHLWQGMSLEAHGVAPDAYQSADRACERLETRVRRYKSKSQTAWGRGDPTQETQAVSYVIQASQEEQEERDEDNPIIIAEAKTPVHEMAVADAVMQMDLSDQPFVVFRNASHGEINVVYRREDGNIGWIDPATPPRSGSEAVAHAKSSRASRETAARSNTKKARGRR